MTMNSRDAANAKGCIDSVISFTKTRLLPHVPEMTTTFTYSAESDSFPMGLTHNFDCLDDGKRHKGRLEKSETLRLDPA